MPENVFNHSDLLIWISNPDYIFGSDNIPEPESGMQFWIVTATLGTAVEQMFQWFFFSDALDVLE